MIGIPLGFLFISMIYYTTGIPCSNLGKTVGTEVKFDWYNGCFLKVGEQFVPKDQLIYLDKDGKIVLTPKVPHRLNIEGLK